MRPVALAPGRILGRYELLLPIAKGGMAEVWAARLHGTRGFQRLVAIKTIVSGTMDDARMEQMFLQEASLAARIQHPNVVATLDLGEEDGNLYMVMEWVDGEPLTVILQHAYQRKSVPLEIAVNLIGQACQGLHAAHELRDDVGVPLGIVHRDISPQNVLVTHSGTVKLVDFGIAKATNVVTGRTSTGEVKGKFAYMAPEQVRGETIDRRTDIFSIGILLYLVTTGRHPYKAATTAHTIHQLCSKEAVIPPSGWIVDYPRALEAVVLRALHKDKSRRFVDARELFEELARAVPHAFQAGFESIVAEYMEELLGNRAVAIRTRLRLAQQALDGTPREFPAVTGGPARHEPPSVGSIRALAIDAGAPSPRVVPPSETHATLASAGVDEPRQETRPRAGNRLKLLLSVAGVAIVATLLAPRLLPVIAKYLAPHAPAPAASAARAHEPPNPATPAPTQPSAPAAEADAETVFDPEYVPLEASPSNSARHARRPSARGAVVRKSQPPPVTAPPPAAPPPVVTAAQPAPTTANHDPLEKRY